MGYDEIFIKFLLFSSAVSVFVVGIKITTLD